MEKAFHDAVYAGFMRVIPTSDVDFLRTIWPKYNNDQSLVRGRCDSCTLHVVTFIGNLYFRTKASVNENNKQQCKQTTTPLEVLDVNKPAPSTLAKPAQKFKSQKGSSKAASNQVK